MPKVSIIMPTYNGSQYIAEAIESAINQTYKDLEIIVVDDGSTDNTKEIVHGYIEKDKRIKYFYKPNGGVASACNFGIDKAQGDYIAYFEHDDISYPQRLEKQIEILEKRKEISFVYSPLEVFNENSEKTDIIESSCEELLEKGLFFKYLLSSSLCANPGIMFRKEITKTIRYDETLPRGLGHDYLFFLQASQSTLFYKIKTPLVKWRRGHNNLSENHLDTFEAERRVSDILFFKNKIILDVTYNQALSMMYVRQARMAITSKHFRSKFRFYAVSLMKAFFFNPLNFSVYKTIAWTVLKMPTEKLLQNKK